MMLHDDVPLYNLRAVVQETGVKPDTLRAWERRYGLPNPQRTEGGHRLYSRRDIETVKWLMAQRDSGLGISKAVSLWKQLETASGNGSVPAKQSSVRPAVTSESYDVMVEKRKEWVAACKRFDERSANRIQSEAFALFSVEYVCFNLLLAGLAELGQGWFEGEITVQQEHFASSLVIRQLDALIAATPPPTRSGRILASCPPGEDHVISLLVLTLLLRRGGWDVVYLGANVPVEHIIQTVKEGVFNAVVTSVQRLQTASSLLELANELKELDIPLVFGGRIFNMQPQIRAIIPGHFLGENLQAAAAIIENIMVARPAASRTDSASAHLQHALHHYRQRLPVINAAMEATLSTSGLSMHQVEFANHNIEANISAALALGDIAYLGEEISWIGGLLDNRDLPDEFLDLYLMTYLETLSLHLDQRGQPIIDWLENEIAGVQSDYEDA